MNILAVDFGLKNIGLALSEGRLAEPFGQLKNNPKLFLKLKNICLENKIKLIIIGLPEGRLVDKIEKFSAKLKKITNLPVIFQDETLTSKEAVRKMVESGKPLKKRKKEEHLVAACLILQSYLDYHAQA